MHARQSESVVSGLHRERGRAAVHKLTTVVQSMPSQLTLLKYCHPGRPRSRANDHVILEEPAKAAIMAQNARTIMMLVMTVAPALDAVA